MTRLIDADALYDLTPEATYAGSFMRELIDAATTITCETCRHNDERCRNAVLWDPQPGTILYMMAGDEFKDIAACSLYEPRQP